MVKEQKGKAFKNYLFNMAVPILLFCLTLNMIDDLNFYSFFPLIVAQAFPFYSFVMRKQEMTVPISQMKLIPKFYMISSVAAITVCSINVYREITLAEKYKDIEQF